MKIASSIVIGLSVIVILVLYFLAQGGSPASDDRIDLSAFSFVDYDQVPVSLSEFQGKPLVVNSWAVWCPFCRKELPDFAELQSAFPTDIVVIAINRQEPLEKSKGYTDELGISDKMVFLLDPSDSFYKAIGGFSMPETIFIDSDGSIVFHKRGPLTFDEMESAVRKHLIR